jgi:hypothetical protein
MVGRAERKSTNLIRDNADDNPDDNPDGNPDDIKVPLTIHVALGLQASLLYSAMDLGKSLPFQLMIALNLEV